MSKDSDGIRFDGTRDWVHVVQVHTPEGDALYLNGVRLPTGTTISQWVRGGTP